MTSANTMRAVWALGLVAAAAGAAQQAARCAMRPVQSRYVLPAGGWRAVEPTPEAGAGCDEMPVELVRRVSFGRGQALLVAADGPHGSGRYWTISAGIGTARATVPSRGICFGASTHGWRTLQSFPRALPWADDMDRDGRPELIVWSNFGGLDEDDVQSGLVAWVYEFDLGSTFALDLELSRRLNAEVAAAYRAPLPEAHQLLQGPRARAAAALEDFATGRCTLGEG